MTNDYGEYLDYQRKKNQTNQQRAYYEAIKSMYNDDDTLDGDSYEKTYDSYDDYLDYKKDTATDPEEKEYYEFLQTMQNDDGTWRPSLSTGYVSSPIIDDPITPYESIEPITVEDDEELQDALNGEGTSGSERDLDFFDTGEWGGMESGAINYDSTQSPNWLATVPEQYRVKANQWSENQGICEIIPMTQQQKFTYTTVTYIAHNTQEPKTQRFPISDVSAIPHQIKFNMYETTEGCVGVSNAVEQNQSIEFDVYLTDYVFYYWNFGADNENTYYIDVLDKHKSKIWDAIGDKTYTDSNLIKDLEDSTEFITFRNSFLQQHSGWICQFNSHAFGTFVGVINDVSYQINSGETFAKWHIKIEEAIFNGDDYSTDGKKKEVSDDSSETDSGSGTDVEVTPT